MQNILCNVRRSIPILVTKIWSQWRNLDYGKSLQAKYFISENILIYGINPDNKGWKKPIIFENCEYTYIVYYSMHGDIMLIKIKQEFQNAWHCFFSVKTHRGYIIIVKN